MIEVQNLTKRYGTITAIENVSFRVDKGEILGFLGPNGAGKTTTMRIITGYMPPTEGTARIADYDIVEDSLEAKRRIGYLPEILPLYDDMTVGSYLGFVADIKKLPKNKKKSMINTAMEKCGITEVRGRLIGHLSKGYRQRIGIAQAIVHNPDVLVLDEPTIGLDPKQIIEIREFIKGLAGEHTVILSTHILPEVAMTCTQVAIINEGRIVLEDTLKNLSERVKGIISVVLKTNYGGDEVIDKIKSLPFVSKVTENAKGEFVVEAEGEADLREGLAKLVIENGWGLLEIRPVTPTLEEVFLKVISGEVEE